MPARDAYHHALRTALEKDGWTITHDPLVIRWGKKDLYIDLGAEQLLAAEKENQKIAVEVKSFSSRSVTEDLEKALGQYILYYDILERLQSDRILYLAVHQEVFEEVFEEPIGMVLLENKRFKIIVFDEIREVVIKWII